MALLPLKSVFLWEQQWHPCAIFASVSILFFSIWLMDLNALATISVVGLLFNFIDFIVPIISNTICGPNSWTGQKEKLFEEICRSIVIHYNKLSSNIKSFYSMRENSPLMVSSVTFMYKFFWLKKIIQSSLCILLFSVLLNIHHHAVHLGLDGFIHQQYIPVVHIFYRGASLAWHSTTRNF